MNVKTHTAKPEAFYPGNDFDIDEDNITQVAWNIGSVTILLDIPRATIRFYSDVLNLDLKRSKRNYRIYRRQDIDQLQILLKLIRAGLDVHVAAKNIKNATEVLKALKRSS